MADLELSIARVISSFIGLATAASAKMFGRRLDWLPLEERQRRLAQRITMGLSAVFIAILWALSSNPGTGPFLFATAGSFVIAAVVVFLILRRVLDRVSFIDRSKVEDGQVTERTIIGGFALTPEANEQLGKAKTVQRLFEGSGYNPDLVWPRESRSKATTAVTTLFIALFATGSIGLSAMAFAVSSELQTEEAHQADRTPVSVQSTSIRGKTRLKEFLIEVGRRPAPHTRAQLRLRGCAIQASIHVRSDLEGTRLSVGGRLYSAANQPVLELADPTLRVVDDILVTAGRTEPLSATIWVQLPKGAPGPFYVQVSVRRPLAKAFDTRKTDMFSTACAEV